MFNPFRKNIMTEEKKKEAPKKNLLQKLKESADDKEEQLVILSTFVRLGILIWSGAILTLAYVELPEALKMPKQDLDPTFIASVFTGVLATFGVQTAKKGAHGGSSGPAPITKEQMEVLIQKAADTAPGQTIRIEAPAVRIVSDENTNSPKES